MDEDLIPWGTPLAEQRAENLDSEQARRLAHACVTHPAFEVLEFRQLDRLGRESYDIVVVRCTNQEIPNRNPNGIRVRETLALTVPVAEGSPPEVRALRRDFPVVPHLNAVLQGEPKSLCLSIQSWSAARRTWTPQRFLATIMWWLKETANGTLHLRDQPVERIYFDFGAELVLPAEYRRPTRRNLRLAIYRVQRTEQILGWTLVAMDSADVATSRGGEYVPVYLSLERVHGSAAWMPASLGALADEWATHGVALGQKLVEQLRDLAGGGQMEVAGQNVVLILEIGIRREPGSPIERTEWAAFLIRQPVVSLAYAMGAVTRQNFMYFAPSDPSPTAADDSADNWKPINLMPLDVKLALTPMDAREQAGVSQDAGDSPRVLLGLGALGSALADIWAREGWGQWTYVDPDHVQPHNLVRHRALYGGIGHYKVDVIKTLVENLYPSSESRATTIPTSATATNPALADALARAELVVDVSTTLEVPRELAQREGAKRMVSAFITPSGRASVLLLEDAARNVPLDCIEAQYYRQILRSDWGESHLQGHGGAIAVGAGCRDVSFVMSPEDIELHAAILARQVRVLTAAPQGAIRVWIASDDGSVGCKSTAISPACRLKSEHWDVVIDDDVIERMDLLRAARLPKETGGIILGYTDHVSRTIYVVDVMAAPSDSLEESAGFVRGAEGLPEAWSQVQEKTAAIVNYVGEWHSHPPRHGATPSFADLTLVAELGHILANDGDPALMVIIGETEVSVFVCESNGSTARISCAVPPRKGERSAPPAT